MLDQVEEVASQANAELQKISSPEELEAWRVRYLGRKSKLNNILRSLSDVPIEERKALGARANQIRSSLESSFSARKDTLESSATVSLERDKIDVSLPGEPCQTGRIHPTTKTIKEICNIFVSMGFQVAEGPQVEWEHYNFEALNMPAEHPARDGFATLWVDYHTPTGARPMLMRTHTSPVQVRVMEKRKPPIRIIVPGRVFRRETTDATHLPMFYQVEGLVVDEGVTFAHLKGTLEYFIRTLFGEKLKIRFRPSFFPFTEPSAEDDISCVICGGSANERRTANDERRKCPVCGGKGWLEILGAGMVNPKVFEAVGYDPKKVTGLAFGMGVERIAMLKYGINDIRLFCENDVRFLRQF